MRIYIAGPYSQNLTASPETRHENTIRAIDAGIALVDKGHAPFIPHLTHWVDQRLQELNRQFSWQQYMDWDREWLRMCDALLYLGSSRGADQELRWAQQMGLKVFFDVEAVPDES